MPESLEEKLDRHLRSGLEGPGEVRLGELYVAARDEGASRTRSWRLAVEATDDPQVQRRWADWERIHDQGELALRLRALVEHQSLDEELADFLMFFFRASAPGLYRPAALAVGRHAGDRPELIDRLEEYAARFDVDLDQSIALNGERSRRRLLLAAAGRAAVEQRDVPVEEGAAERLPAESGSDLSVLCRAVAHLLEAGRQPGHLVQTAWTLLGDLERHAGTGGARRSVAREWGVLLRALADRDADRAAREWADELRRIAQRRDDTYAP
ncbi:MAG: hypothetical protein ABEL76_12060, partial [Bradymonadaceae bacterium]